MFEATGLLDESHKKIVREVFRFFDREGILGMAGGLRFIEIWVF